MSEASPPEIHRVPLPENARGKRLDKALAEALSDTALTRSRLRALIETGCVHRLEPEPRATLREPSLKVKGGEVVTVAPPPPAPARPQPQAIPLSVIHEDSALIVVEKPAGMVVHPAPGAEDGTLVNALLAHCGDSLSGIGGERRPGIVHRIDKDTSGLLVVAKTDAAHQGLAAQFAAHDLERSYLALVWGAPSAADPRVSGLPGVTREPGATRIETLIGRSQTDRKKMAVQKRDGKRAVTRFRIMETLGPCALTECRLETGRTHQIRVHMAHIGHPLVGDPSYGRGRKPPATLPAEAASALNAFPRQALHAATLGFTHPVTGEALRFQSRPPEDFATLLALLRG